MTRKPWLAAVLSLLMPGLGHIYSGALERGAIIWCAWQVAAPAIFAITVRLPAWAGALAPFVLLITGLAAIMVDAARSARRAPRPFVPESYNRWFVYLTLPFFFGPPVFIPLQALIKKHIYETFKLPSDAMAPTILAGDWIYATSWRGTLDRGAIVVFRRHGEAFIKRAVAIAGDTVAMRNDSLFVNGRYVAEPYAIPAGEGVGQRGEPTQSSWNPVVVPRGACFVLGDNRAGSLDSREYGPVRLDSIVKRPIGVYFSLDPETHKIRWSRIGQGVSR